MARVLLLLPTGTYRAPDFVAAATALGAEVVVGSERRQALADGMGDRALVVDMAHPDAAVGAVLGLHQRSPIDAVVAVDDQGGLVAARASERLGFLHNPPDAVAATRDKAAMRKAFSTAGLAQPAWRLAHPGDAVAELAAKVGFPCVVKPLSLSASRGVIRADTPEDAVAAVARVRAILDDAAEDPTGPVLIERFVPGAEVAVEALLEGGRLRPLAVFDKPDPLDGPYFEETIYVTPSRLAGQDAVVEAAARGATALGLTEGPIHAEARIGLDGAVWLLELAARSIGGLCSRALRFGAGVSLEELILRHALRLPLDDLARERAASGVMMLPIPAAGTLRAVHGQNEARAVPGIVGLEISVPIGRPVRPLPEGDRYLGFLFARGDTPEAVEASLREAHAALRIDIA
jgi:biotin carboxylase